jgi:hypothetical protein
MAMGLVTESSSEFVFVTCRPRTFLWYFPDRLTAPLLYTNFHALLPRKQSAEVEGKVGHWKTRKRASRSRPPSVLIIGIDSTSRLAFRRSMPATINVLQTMGAHEIKGYTKGRHSAW